MANIDFSDKRPPEFPPVNLALKDPDGLLAVGGDLNPEWLTEAYNKGIFPWFNSDEQEILWWSPSERAIIYPGEMHVSGSLKKVLRKELFSVSFDESFDQVIDNCSIRNEKSEGTWITERMKTAYKQMHSIGIAHSVEVKFNEKLVGGLYGISLGKMFFGESMFSRVSNASKIALYFLQKRLVDWEFSLIDCQMMNPHLQSLGAINMPREHFVDLVEKNSIITTQKGNWTSLG